MTTIYISQSNCTKDGKKITFAYSGCGVQRGGNVHIISPNGIITTRKGVEEKCLIPWEEIDKLVGQHEPALAIGKVENP